MRASTVIAYALIGLLAVLITSVAFLPVGTADWALERMTAGRLRLANTSFALATQPLQYGTDITGLALSDKAATLRWLDAYLQELTDLRRLIQSGDREMIDLTLGNLLIQRERWLRERSENEWTEGVEINVDRPTLSDQFLGGWLGGKLKKEKDDE